MSISEGNKRRVAILAGKRIPFQRSFGAYRGISATELMQLSLDALVKENNLTGKELGEVALGAVTKRAAEWNLARNVVVNSPLHNNTPGITLSRACGTSLDAAIEIANKISMGQIEAGIAGGTDTNSDPPIEFQSSFAQKLLGIQAAKTAGQRIGAMLKISLSDLKPNVPAVVEPATGMSMGQSCEVMVKDWNVTREEQDELAYRSHQNAAKAYEEGFYKDQVVEFQGKDRDGLLRADTSMEKLAKLRPAFDRSENGTLTAGNSTALTDGSSCVLLASEEWAKENGFEPIAYLEFVQNAAVDFVKAEGLLMAPAYAVSKMLKRANLSLQDFDFYEIHEAFAGQVMCTLKSWESEEFCKRRLGLDKALGSIDRSKLNVKGSSLALGHPFAATGTRILHTAAKLLNEKGSGRVLLSICTAGGMGTTAIVSK
ncbi:MAG: acetyl-CoA C-acetyltransferase [Bdellovibrionota bacterium]|nr:acetyl-CoA C-acetyltransferase [Bdellovibrionota bacterium]